MIATVVPDVPSFDVDQGFRYRVPDTMTRRIAVGSRVRIPLGGRKTGGVVIDVHDGDETGLRAITGVSGSAPTLDPRLLATMQWAARHYVAPLSVMLSRTAPPNVPPGSPTPPTPHGPGHATSGTPELDRLSAAVVDAIAGRMGRPRLWLAGRDHQAWVSAVDRAAGDHSVLVIVPTGAELRALAADLARLGERLVVVDPDLDAAETTAKWARIAHHGGLVVGTPRVASWPVARLVAVAAIEESRRAMKDRQTPTIHVRDLLRARAQRGRHASIFAGPTPSLELMSWGPDVIRPRPRAWPLVEIVDRRADPPGSGLIAAATMVAIRAVTRKGGDVFVFAHRRGYSGAARCVACRTLRRCPECGSRPDPGEACQRCGAPLGPCVECGGSRFEPLGAGVGRVAEEIARSVGRDLVGRHPTAAPVTVGSERDLVDVQGRDLVVAVDLDGLVFGPNYRASEEALRIGARLATTLRPGSGRRLIVQTTDPSHPVVEALRSGDPLRFAESELSVREQLGYPPAGDLVVIEVRGGPEGQAKQVDLDLGELPGATVLGPAPSREGTRWLIQGRDLAGARQALRPMVQRWRDARTTVRVDVDPIDL